MKDLTPIFPEQLPTRPESYRKIPLKFLRTQIVCKVRGLSHSLAPAQKLELELEQCQDMLDIKYV
jgi:hypothetical protein